MSRKPRVLGPSGFYHVTLRGIDGLKILEGQREKLYFLKVLQRMGKEGEYSIHAYCLMNNHAHLLLKTGNIPLAKSMKRITVSFVYYYNKLHNRSGPLLNDRYHSSVIKDEVQLLVCARYIHNNPIKAGIVDKPEAYPWSSYRYYLGLDSISPIPITTQEILNLFHPRTDHAIADLKAFTEIEDKPITVQDCVEEILRQEHVSQEEIKKLPRQRRDSIIRKILAQSGARAKDISNLLGLSTTVIYKARRSGGQK